MAAVNYPPRAQELPPVKSSKMGSRPMGAPMTAGLPPTSVPMHMQAEAILNGKEVPEHPFDTPFSIIKTMQAELVRLKEEQQREQHERKADVAALKRELVDVKEHIRKVEQKQEKDHLQITHTVSELQIKEEHDWTTTRKEMQAEFAKRCMCVQHEALVERVSANSKWLKETSEKLNERIGGLERGIQANADGDNDFAQEMKNELQAQRREIDVNGVNDEEFARNVLSRMRAAGQFLKTAGMAPPPDKTGLFAGEGQSPPRAMGNSDQMGAHFRRALGSLIQDEEPHGAVGLKASTGSALAP